jgi:hypothetical protein
VSGNEDEQETKGGVDKKGDSQNHDGSLGEKLADVGLENSREAEGGVLAEANEGHDGI